MRKFFLPLLFIAITIADAHADDISTAKPKNAELIYQYVGTYNYDGLLKEAFVDTQLKKLLGAEYPHFMANMSELRRPIDFVNGSLAAYGTRSHFPVRETAVLCVDTHQLKVHVGMYTDTSMTIYTPEKNYRSLPPCLTGWVNSSLEPRNSHMAPPPQSDGEFHFTHKVVDSGS